MRQGHIYIYICKYIVYIYTYGQREGERERERYKERERESKIETLRDIDKHAFGTYMGCGSVRNANIYFRFALRKYMCLTNRCAWAPWRRSGPNTTHGLDPGQ